MREAIRDALANGCTTAIAMGGDGTLQMLASEVISNAVNVGVIPAGGGNDFATALGIPKNVELAVEILVRGKTRLVDAVCARFADGTEKIFLGGGGIGLDARAASYSNGKFAKWPGRLRYILSALAALRGFKGIAVRVEFRGSDAAPWEEKALLVAALNTPSYGAGLKLAPDARIDDGLLEVVLLKVLSTAEVLRLLPRLLASGELRTRHLIRMRAARVQLEAADHQKFHGDGEVLGTAPVDIEIVRSALRVLVP
jgi:diacylglycerol kinase (ATP)